MTSVQLDNKQALSVMVGLEQALAEIKCSVETENNERNMAAFYKIQKAFDIMETKMMKDI